MAEKEKRMRVQYTTPLLISQINSKNKELYQKYLNGKRSLSKSTQKGYQSDINQFFVFLLRNYDNKYLLDFDVEGSADMLDDFVAMCTSILGNKDRRITRRLSSISSIYIYFKKKRKIKENPVELLERPTIVKGKYEVKQTFLSQEQVNLIREKLAEIDDKQLTCFFNVGLCTMARANALSNIKIENIDIEKKRITGNIEKEGYVVTLMLDDRCISNIKDLLEERKQKGIESEFLFITRYGGEWKKADKSALQSGWIKKIGEFINEPELHCHDLRHSGSNLRFQAGMKLETVSKLLSHKSTQVTQDFYLKTNDDKLQEEMEQFNI